MLNDTDEIVVEALHDISVLVSNANPEAFVLHVTTQNGSNYFLALPRAALANLGSQLSINAFRASREATAQ